MQIVIIGNGAAGNQAAMTICESDSKANVIILGCESVPFYSPCALPDYLAGWIRRDQLFLKSRFDQSRIEIRLGQMVEDIKPDRQAIAVNGQILGYDRLIIASGSRPVVPPVSGAELPGNFVVKSIYDVERIMAHNPRKAAVIGSGNIGVETAEALRIRGCKVSIVEMMPRIMPRLFDERPARLIARILEERGIEIFTGEKAREVSGKRRVEGLITDRREIACDAVIWAAGVRQNTELAAAAGIEIGSLGGIKVDSGLQTSCPDIFACGDCIETVDLLTGRPTLCMLWPCAKAQAEAAARNCLGDKTVYPGALKLISEEVFGRPCIAAGLLEEELGGGEGLDIIEKETENTCHRLLIQNGRIMGVQAVGSVEGIGTLISFMKNKIPAPEISRMFNSPMLREKMPWMLALNDYLPMGTGEGN